MSGAQETFEALSHFFILLGGMMKEYGSMSSFYLQIFFC